MKTQHSQTLKTKREILAVQDQIWAVIEALTPILLSPNPSTTQHCLTDFKVDRARPYLSEGGDLKIEGLRQHQDPAHF